MTSAAAARRSRRAGRPTTTDGHATTGEPGSAGARRGLQPEQRAALSRRTVLATSATSSIRSAARAQYPAGVALATELDLQTSSTRVQRRVLWLATASSTTPTACGEPQRDQGRRPPGLERVDGLAHDRAVLRASRGARPRVSVKPHASPVLHAINYLLGRLDPALPDDACASTGACSPIRAARRTRTPSTTRPAASGSAPPRRSGARSRTATSPATSTSRAAGARSR